MISVTKATDATALDELAKCMRNGRVCVLFYADWCGHCQRFKPEWSQCKEMHQKQQNNSYKLADIESAALDALKGKMSDMPSLVDVSGFPTISMYDNGKKTADYNGERTADALMTFLNQQYKEPASHIPPILSNETTITITNTNNSNTNTNNYNTNVGTNKYSVHVNSKSKKSKPKKSKSKKSKSKKSKSKKSNSKNSNSKNSNSKNSKKNVVELSPSSNLVIN